MPEVSIHLIVYNGEKYIRRCLEHVKAQTYSNVKFRIFNNASTDRTIEIARKVWDEGARPVRNSPLEAGAVSNGIEIINFSKNYVLGGGFNRGLYYPVKSQGDHGASPASPYVVGLSVDVMMAPDFIEKAVSSMEAHPRMGVLQAKILRYDYEHNKKTDIIDTTGMQIFRSRRIINRGHGEQDTGQYNKAEEIFCYEGAVPFFRREALEAVKMQKSPHDEKYPYEYLDEDFVWYADEVDLGWRMRLLGWGSWYDPSVIAWHDRQTTHNLSSGYRAFIQQRRGIPKLKRKLDLQNQRLTFIKNDFWINILRDLPWFLKRELFLFLYVLLWERSSLPAYWGIIKQTPRMLKKRREIMQKRKITPREIKKWFL